MAKITRIKASDGPRKREETDEGTVVRKRVSVKDKKSTKAERAKRRAAEKAISAEVVETTEKSAEKASKASKNDEKNAKLNKKVVQSEKTTKKHGKKAGKKPFVLFRPFVALGQYLHDSWLELRQVRWPNRKTTWKMLLAVLVYSALFMILITVLDLAFEGLLNLMFNK